MIAMLVSALWAQTGDVAALDKALLATPTATELLQRWCDKHHPGVTVHAFVAKRATVRTDGAHETRLSLSADEYQLSYRRVQLKCGDIVLSEAENWFVPGRLTPEMNARLLTGDTPFGAVIAPLKPHRLNIESQTQWSGQGPNEVLRHRAVVLRQGSGKPLAEVLETYQRVLLDN